jgi:hypothetical protein
VNTVGLTAITSATLDQAAPAVASLVSNTIAVTMATSIAASAAGAVAASAAAAAAGSAAGAAAGAAAGGAAGGGAAGGGASSGAAGGGGLTPLIFGVQRFSMSSGLAANLSSTLHTTVTGSMSWASGDFNLLSTSTESRRRMSEVDGAGVAVALSPTAKAKESLWNIALVLLCSALLTIGVQTCARWLWRHRTNREYYHEGRYSLKASFKGFPSLFVFPGLLMVVVSIFLSGLVSNSMTLVVSAETETCPASCKALASLVFLVVLVYEGLSLAALLHFNRRYRATVWVAVVPPSEPSKVADPLYRGISKFRALFLGATDSRAVVTRTRGRYAKPKEDAKEPARTERLLAHPWSLLKGSSAGDFIDAYGFALMARAGGMSNMSTGFEFTILATQLVIGMLNGIGSRLEPGSSIAIVQIGAVLALQALHSLWVFRTTPSVDRIMNVVVGIQFLLEACQTCLLLLTVFYPPAPVLQSVSLVVAIASVLTPIIQRFYDAVIVQLFKACKGGFDLRAACFAMLGFLVFIPSMIVKVLGIDTQGADKLAKHAGDDINKLAAKSANEKLALEIEQNAEEVVANLFWNAERNAVARRERAAILIQQRYRQRKARLQQEEMSLDSSSRARNRKQFLMPYRSLMNSAVPKAARSSESSTPRSKRFFRRPQTTPTAPSLSFNDHPLEYPVRSQPDSLADSNGTCSDSPEAQGAEMTGCLAAPAAQEEEDSDLALPRGGHPSRLVRARTANAAAIRVASVEARNVKKKGPDGLPPATPAAVGGRQLNSTSPANPEADSQAAQLRMVRSAPSLGRATSRHAADDPDNSRPGAEWLRRRVDSFGRRGRDEHTEPRVLHPRMSAQIAAQRQSIRVTIIARDSRGASSAAEQSLRAATLKERDARRAVEKARMDVANLLAQAEEIERQAGESCVRLPMAQPTSSAEIILADGIGVRTERSAAAEGESNVRVFEHQRSTRAGAKGLPVSASSNAPLVVLHAYPQVDGTVRIRIK